MRYVTLSDLKKILTNAMSWSYMSTFVIKNISVHRLDSRRKKQQVDILRIELYSCSSRTVMNYRLMSAISHILSTESIDVSDETSRECLVVSGDSVDYYDYADLLDETTIVVECVTDPQRLQIIV